MGELGDRFGDRTPFVGVPALGLGDDLAVLTDEEECGGLGDTEVLRHGAVGVGEGEELVGVGTEVGLCVVDGAGDDPARAATGTLKVRQHAPGRVEDPRALVGVGIEHDGDQREGRHEATEGACFAFDRGQFEIQICCHERQR